MNPSLTESDNHLPCFLNKQSGTPTAAAAEAPPAFRLCSPNLEAPKPMEDNAALSKSLQVL